MKIYRFLVLAYILCIIALFPVLLHSPIELHIQNELDIGSGQADSSVDALPSSLSAPSLVDEFDSSLGYNTSIWNLESFGEGSVSWVSGDYLNISAKRHSYRTLTSKMTFNVGQEVSIRMRMIENEAIVFVGWTNQTPSTGWNYRFGNNSVHIQGALSAALLEVADPDPAIRYISLLSDIDTRQWHTYRIVWNDTVAIAYVDGIRAGVIGAQTPSGPLHFKITITEFRDQETEGWLCIDSVSISPHASMESENPPFIVVNSPGNGTLNLGGEEVDIALVGSNGTLFYSWDGEINRTAVHPFGLALLSSPGVHTLDLYCADGYGYGTWASEHYVFEVSASPPEIQAVFTSQSPDVDGLISENEWPHDSMTVLHMFGPDGAVEDVDVYLAYDDTFCYIAIDSPVASGHDSRAAIILNGIPDGRYHGSPSSPVMSPYYTKGSPKAWEGYSELHFLNESADGDIGNYKLEPIPSGYLYAAVEVETGVHYEFRVPLEELDAQAGDLIGISIMLFPSGLGVFNLYYPMVFPWENAARLALVRLALISVIDPIMFIGIASGIVLFAGVAFVFMRKGRTKDTEVGFSVETVERVSELVRSYEQITLERLSRQTGMTRTETESTIREMISKGLLNAEYDESTRTIRRK
ncbi:MAG: PCI domain-containing protein [Candidatus Thorarchaeota archaeon]